ncbi:MAG TPA: CoA transferase, partial [Mycobacterium sp.]|nr:CoA transferase [Mycobacterium sp.]
MLEGIRVLDAATLAAAPLAATYLGEFGADVIKIEQPCSGDPIRTWGNQIDGVGLMWKSLSRNKRSITLNLRVAEGQALLRSLAEHADVLIVNTRPATLRRWGLDYPALRAVNDRIVMLHITGYGLTGPKSERPGFGTLGEAMSGFANITGRADGPPTLPPFMLADGQELLRQLVEHADVVIVNTRPATLRKWGLDYPTLRAVNDKIVMLHITGYGLTGPKSERPGFGTLGEAMSGFANITGQADGPPTLPPFM